MAQVREGSDPSFCPPVEEGMSIVLADENGDELEFEFLGVLLHEGRRYGFFFPIEDGSPALSSGEVVLLEVTEMDDEGQPESFELVDDEAVAASAWEAFKEATRDLYRFE